MNGCCWFCVVFLVAFGFGSRKGERLFIWKQRGNFTMYGQSVGTDSAQSV